MTLTGSHWLAALHTSKGLYTRLKKCLVLINQANGLLLACFPVSCMASSRHSAVCEGTNCPRAARAWPCPIDRLPARVRPTQDRVTDSAPVLVAGHPWSSHWSSSSLLALSDLRPGFGKQASYVVDYVVSRKKTPYNTST